MAKREKFDVFVVPRNFGEDGMTFNGIGRRNLVEGAILAFSSGFPIVKYLPVSIAVKIVLICFISLPLFFFGLIGIGGQSLSQFITTFFIWLFRRRILHYYIDTGELEPEKKPKKERIKTLLKGKNKEEIRYVKQKKSKKHKASLFDRLFAPKSQAEPAKEKETKSREIYNMVQRFLPVSDIREGMIVTKDGRYIKVVEINPINFLLRSADEQSDIVMSFAELLRIAPIKIQFKCNSNRADISKFIARTRREIELETNEACKAMSEDYIEHFQNIATNNAISRRFFVIFEYDNMSTVGAASEQEIQFQLDSATRSFRTYLSRCGNMTVEFENSKEENRFLLDFLYVLLDYYNVDELSLDDKINRAFKMRLSGRNSEEMCAADYISPDRIDFTHSKYVVIDGVYHSYLYIPTSGFKTLVGAAWLSPLINAGEAIDVDLFLQKQPADRMQTQVSRNLRLNKSRLNDISSTSADFNRMGDIMESGYYLQQGLNDGQDFFYMNVLVTVKAYSQKDLENRTNEVIKMMVAKQLTLKICSYMQEEAFLSTLPVMKISPKLFQLGKRNILLNTAASTYMFTSFEICDDTGILLGTNEHNNSLAVLDSFNSKIYKNANISLVGTSGAGKTFTLQTIATRFRRKHIPTYIIAPLKGHEFARCAKEIGGNFVRISTGSAHCINVMEIRKVDHSANELLDGEIEEQSLLSTKIDSLLVFFSILMPEMTNVEEQLLDGALMKTYANKGITNDNTSLLDPNDASKYREMPILGDLQNVLLEIERADRLAIILDRFVNGSAKSFNQQTNVDLTNPYTVIDISYLKSGKMLSAGMFIALDFIWDRVKEDRMENIVVGIDEVWKMIGGGGGDNAVSRLAAEYVLEVVKTIRGFGGSVILAMQDISDLFAFDGGKYGKAIIGNSKIKIILNLEPNEAELAREVLILLSNKKAFY